MTTVRTRQPTSICDECICQWVQSELTHLSTHRAMAGRGLNYICNTKMCTIVQLCTIGGYNRPSLEKIWRPRQEWPNIIKMWKVITLRRRKGKQKRNIHIIKSAQMNNNGTGRVIRCFNYLRWLTGFIPSTRQIMKHDGMGVLLLWFTRQEPRTRQRT